MSLISDLWILVTWRLKEASYWEAPQMLAELISSAILYYLLQKKISSTLSNSIQSLINKWVTLWPGSRRGVAREHGDPVWGATRSPGWTARLQLHPDKHHHLQQPREEHQIRVPGTSFENTYTLTARPTKNPYCPECCSPPNEHSFFGIPLLIIDNKKKKGMNICLQEY